MLRRRVVTNRSLAVRLPKAYQFSTAEVVIRKEGDDVIGAATAHRVVMTVTSATRVDYLYGFPAVVDR